MSAQASNEGPESIHEVVDRTMETAENEEKLQVGDLLDSFGSRAFGPLFFILGAISASPVGSIPGASIVIGALLLLLAAQMIFTDDAPWAPEALRNVGVSGEKARKAGEKARPYLKRLERVVKKRAEKVFTGPYRIVVAILIIVFGVTFFPLALVPYGVLAPSLAVMLIGAAMTSRDGVVLVGACVFGVVGSALTAWFAL